MSFLPRLTNDDDDPSVETHLTFLFDALTRPPVAGKPVRAITIPAPSDSLEKFLRLVPRDRGFCWRSPGGRRMAGGGSAVVIESSGDRSLPGLRAAATEAWDQLHVIAAPGVQLKPVFFGGIAFAPEVARIEPWSEFGSDGFGLCRWTYDRVGAAGFLTLAVRDEERATLDQVESLVAEARRILHSLHLEAPTSLIERCDISPSAVHHSSLHDWTAYIESILDAIRSTEFDKIVAARRCVVDLNRPLEDTGFMARLFAAYADCTHFAVRRPTSTFLGATPETLFRKQGTMLKTHALAGTTRVKDDPGSDSSLESAALRRSMKDLTEHALVVKRICDELWPLSKTIRYSSTPQARHVRNLVHLQTPIEAELHRQTHVFDLLSALHPTPAVGGFPAREAATWISRNEPIERGWYTGVVGWFNGEGDGEFAVAIRCGVLTKRRAHIYAGAGIVLKSDPASEYAETAAKMQPILRALGVTL